MLSHILSVYTVSNWIVNCSIHTDYEFDANMLKFHETAANSYVFQGRMPSQQWWENKINQIQFIALE